MEPTSTYDPELAVRSAILGGVLAFLVAHNVKLSPEVTTALGVVLGAIYDAIAYQIKSRMKQGKS